MTGALTRSLATIVLAIAGASALAAAADKPTREWSGADVNGNAVKVPSADRPSVLLFVMADQKQSADALKQLAGVKSAADAQVIVIVTGAKAAAEATTIAGDPTCHWPVVSDPDYAATGRMSVRVWPTTVIIGKAGEEIAHMAGLSKHYAADVESYMAFATGRMDKAALEQRLANHDVIADAPEQAARRHLQVARLLLEKGLFEQARAQVRESVKLNPQSTALQLEMARLLLSIGETDEAAKVLDRLNGAPLTRSQVCLLRGKLLAQSGKWDEAISMLQDSIRLNPDPAEALYELGLVYQHKNDYPRAAEAFRKAFETSESGRKLAPTTRPAGDN